MRFRRRSYVPADVPATDPPLRITDVRVEPEGLVVDLVRADEPAEGEPIQQWLAANPTFTAEYLQARYGNPPSASALEAIDTGDVYEDDLCRTCREPIQTMTFRGTGYCSINCKERR